MHFSGILIEYVRSLISSIGLPLNLTDTVLIALSHDLRERFNSVDKRNVVLQQIAQPENTLARVAPRSSCSAPGHPSRRQAPVARNFDTWATRACTGNRSALRIQHFVHASTCIFSPSHNDPGISQSFEGSNIKPRQRPPKSSGTVLRSSTETGSPLHLERADLFLCTPSPSLREVSLKPCG